MAFDALPDELVESVLLNLDDPVPMMLTCQRMAKYASDQMFWARWADKRSPSWIWDQQARWTETAQGQLLDSKALWTLGLEMIAENIDRWEALATSYPKWVLVEHYEYRNHFFLPAAPWDEVDFACLGANEMQFLHIPHSITGFYFEILIRGKHSGIEQIKLHDILTEDILFATTVGDGSSLIVARVEEQGAVIQKVTRGGAVVWTLEERFDTVERIHIFTRQGETFIAVIEYESDRVHVLSCDRQGSYIRGIKCFSARGCFRDVFYDEHADVLVIREGNQVRVHTLQGNEVVSVDI